jgi:pimeloyl-ACP methyl ester carboxylesterase
VPEKVEKINGVDLCTESFGDPSDPTVLLIMGAFASMLWWPEAFCRRLAEGGRHVIRYDNRDTGRSIAYPLGHPGYSLEDLADDATMILSAYGVNRAHLVGMSLGGMIAQIVALKYPERVLSLSLIMSSVFGPPNPDLPGPDDRIVAYHRSSASPDWNDKPAVVNYSVEGWRLLSGSAHAFDESTVRETAVREVDRSANLPSMFNHALLKGGEQWHGKIDHIRVPTVVIHGTEDPALPYPHGIELARTIPGARLVTLERTGHELNRGDWDEIIAALLQHTAES